MRDPLSDALALQRAAAAEGFDWSEPAPLWAKLEEEIGELRTAATAADRAEELGDLLFMVVNIARHLEIDPASALAGASAKFARRYAFVMAGPAELPLVGDPDRIERMEARWQEAKRREREAAGG